MNELGKVIGKGSFSKVYRKGESKKVTIVSNDCTKECYSLNSVGRLFPRITRLEYGIYEMPYLPKVKSLKNNLEARQWELYKALRGIYQSLLYPYSEYDYYKFIRNSIDNLPRKFSNERKKILEMIDCLANYGSDICFEISPRNVAVKNGKLILLDCFFLKSQLREVRR